MRLKPRPKSRNPIAFRQDRAILHDAAVHRACFRVKIRVTGKWRARDNDSRRRVKIGTGDPLSGGMRVPRREKNSLKWATSVQFNILSWR